MQTADLQGRLAPGDPVPWFIQRSTNAPEFFFGNLAGRTTVVFAFGSAAHTPARAVIKAFLAHRELFDDDTCTLMGISVDPADEATGRIRQVVPGFRCLWDFDHRASRVLGTSDGPRSAYQARTLVLDRRLRLAASFALQGSTVEDATAHVAEVVAFLQERATPARPVLAQAHAPVLVIPDVFEADLCEALIEHYASHDAMQSGTMSQEGGRTVYKLNLDRKRRADCELPEDHPLRAAALDRIRRRVIPAIGQAFQFRATRIERYIVACYRASDRGFFVAHRDNTTPGTAHRRFAVSIGLNGDYDGGELVFGEYGDHRFKVPAGGAVVFGCSLLHEVKPVTRGDRYAFLPFLYDEAAAQVRRANAHLVDGAPTLR
jgi:predicted 2-oxoglutarate/Fe(II)-dependent dioxygenase YbiX/peroxiredoxin